MSSYLHPGLLSRLFLVCFPTKTQYAFLFFPVRATCLAHVFLLNLMTPIIIGEEYRSWSRSLQASVRPQLKCDGTRWRTRGEVKGKLANGVGSQYFSHYLRTPLLPLMRTPPMPVVDWTDAPADLNGLVCFAKRRNLVSAHVLSHSRRSLPLHCGPIQMTAVSGLAVMNCLYVPHIVSFPVAQTYRVKCCWYHVLVL